jgi:hypothetical protein
MVTRRPCRPCRSPAVHAWDEWNRADSYRTTTIENVGGVESWVEVTEVDEPLVSFRGTYVFGSDGEVLTSDSTLRFRDEAEVTESLVAHGYLVDEVRDAPDRPGRELVFLARRPDRVGLVRSRGCLGHGASLGPGFDTGTQAVVGATSARPARRGSRRHRGRP